MDDADDCFDAWEYDPAEEDLGPAPGGDEAFADAAEELFQDERTVLVTAPELLQPMTPAARPQGPPQVASSSGFCATASPQASSLAASDSRTPRAVLPLVLGDSSPATSTSSAAAAESSAPQAKRRRLARKQAPPQAPSAPEAAPAAALIIMIMPVIPNDKDV